jgi:hypothetical protein
MFIFRYFRTRRHEQSWRARILFQPNIFLIIARTIILWNNKTPSHQEHTHSCLPWKTIQRNHNPSLWRAGLARNTPHGIPHCQIESLPRHVIFDCWSTGGSSSMIQHHDMYKGLSSGLEENVCCWLMDCKGQETILMFQRQGSSLLCPSQRMKEGRSCCKCVGCDIFESNQSYKNKLEIVGTLPSVKTVLISFYKVSCYIKSGFAIAPNSKVATRPLML